MISSVGKKTQSNKDISEKRVDRLIYGWLEIFYENMFASIMI